jgi:hypothetical protein
MITARDVVVRALTRLRIVAPGEAVPAHLAAQGLASLNAMRAAWQNSGIFITIPEFVLTDEFWFFVPAKSVAALTYKGSWNASTDTPALASAIGARGDAYRVTVAGAVSLSGLTPWIAGQVFVSDGAVWTRGETSDRLHQAVIDLLAVQIAPDFGRDPSPYIQRSAEDGWNSILAAFVRAPTATFDRGLVDLPARRWRGTGYSIDTDT